MSEIVSDILVTCIIVSAVAATICLAAGCFRIAIWLLRSR